MDEIFSRTAGLITEEGVKKLNNATVAVVGLGGVGGHAAEALARSGTGTLLLFDSDRYTASNINRQAGALHSTIGELKTDVTARRIQDINSKIIVEKYPIFITPETDFPFDRADYIIDAVDNVTAKLFLALGAQESGTPIISVMGTGNKLDPTRLRISDISETRECRLCKVMRYECKKRGIKKLDTVWTDERTKKSPLTENGKPVPASMIFVPASAGMLAASYAVRKILDSK